MSHKDSYSFNAIKRAGILNVDAPDIGDVMSERKKYYAFCQNNRCKMFKKVAQTRHQCENCKYSTKWETK
jgi:hypothetical protein